MDKRDHFEKKLKEKLEEFTIPDLDQAWENFAPNLSDPRVPFWKHWSLPYLFASTLFLVSLWWQKEEKGIPVNGNLEKSTLLTAIDTVYLRDTVYVVDTVVVVKQILIQEENQDQPISNRSVSKDDSAPAETLSEKPVASENNKAGSKQGNLLPSKTNANSGSPDKTGSQSYTSSAPFSNLEKQESINQDTTKLALSAVNYSDQSVRRSMAAPSVGVKEKIEFRIEKEQVVGDTSNLSNPPLPAKSKPMVQVEGVSSLLFPISRLVEYYNPVQYGLQVGLEWESGWGIFAGAIRSRIEGELDDEEIMQLSQPVISRLPNIPTPIESLDEIYVKDQQWFFPLELRWRSLYYSGFSFESSVGIMGNYLNQQDFTYEFENDFTEEYQFGKVSNRSFGINHMRFGLGTNYLFSKRVGIFIRSHYWLPISGQGLINNKMHGLEIGTGLSILLGN